MAESFTRGFLAQVVLGAAQADVYLAPTQPPNAQVVVNSVIIANISGSVRTFTLRIGSGVLTSSNSLFEAVSINNNTTYIYPGSEWGLTIPANYKLTGLASAASAIVVSLFGAVQS